MVHPTYRSWKATQVGSEIIELAGFTDSYIRNQRRAINKAVPAPIEDVFSPSPVISTVVAGHCRTRLVSSKWAKKLKIVGIKETQEVTCTGVEVFRKLLDEGRAGENVGVLLRGIKREEIERVVGVLAKPGTIKPHTKSSNHQVYILSKDEGGRHTPFFKATVRSSTSVLLT